VNRHSKTQDLINTALQDIKDGAPYVTIIIPSQQINYWRKYLIESLYSGEFPVTKIDKLTFEWAGSEIRFLYPTRLDEKLRGYSHKHSIYVDAYLKLAERRTEDYVFNQLSSINTVSSYTTSI